MTARQADAVAVNLVGVTMGERAGETILRRAAHLTPRVILVGGVEADDVDSTDGLGLPKPAWQVIHARNHDARDGVLLLLDRDRVEPLDDPRWVLTAPAHAGSNADRFALVLRVLIDRGPHERRRKVAVVHVVPARAPRGLYAAQMQAIHRLRADVTLADWNADRRTVARHSPGRDVYVPAGDVMGHVTLPGRSPSRVARSLRCEPSDHRATVIAV